MQGPDQTLMTYDRLKPDRNCSDLWCVRGKPGTWKAVSIPPTTQLNPIMAHDRSQIMGREEAIRINPLITEDRKAFLIARLQYWDEWAAKENKGGWRLGDSE